VNGTPAQLTSGPISYSQPRISRDGKTLFVIGEERRGELMRYDLKTRDLVPFLPRFSADHVSFSRDGQWMAYVQYPEGTLWRSRVDGSERLQLTAAPLRTYVPRWSPDGKWIAFVGIQAFGQLPKLYRVPKDGLTAPEALLASDAEQWSTDWSPDGRQLILASAATDSAGIASLAILDLPTKKVTPLAGSRGMQGPQWSPDGRYLAARSSASKRLKLYDSRKGQWMDLGIEGVEYPSWSQDGAYIYYNTFFAQQKSIFRLRVADRKPEKLYTLKDFLPAGVYGAWSGVSPDGSALVLHDAGSRDVYAIDVELP
jgi:Tol biopolymer transport system component